jgi:DNA polymerase III delta subunit
MLPTEFIALMHQGKPGPAYFLRGPDRFLHEECRAAVLAALPPEAREWCLNELEFQPARLKSDLEGALQMPMLGGRSYFLISDTEDFRHAGEEDFEALDAYLARPSSFATVIFGAIEPDRRRRFIQCLEKRAEVVEMLPPNRREAVAWLKAYLRRAQVEVESEIAEQIVQRFEGFGEAARGARGSGVNLLWLRTELEKLLAARPQARRIEKADLGIIVGVREEHEIGKLLAAIADRQCSQALEVLRSLVAGKEPETLLLWCVGDLFRQALRAGPQSGFTRGWQSRFSNPYSTFEVAPRAAKAYTREELLHSVRLVHAADLAVKSSWKDAQVLLEALVWQIISGRSAGTLPLAAQTLASLGIE